jgi:uncharacterized protein YcbX
MQKHILTEIWIYPVKSLGGVRLASSDVMEKGLRYDRRWMLVDDHGKFMTQRTTPKMALFKLRPKDGGFTIEFSSDVIALPIITTSGGKTIKAQIWDDAVDVVDEGDLYSRWFSERLGVSCRLVSFPEGNARLIDPDYRLADEHVSLADGYPVLVIGEATLADLNSRLEQPVPMNRFRPNLVFTGGAAYEEDGWKNFMVGENRFVGVKPCARCVLTTVDQATGEKGREPLLTLSRYRKDGDRILFGQNAIPIDYHEIHEGDEIKLF